MRIRAAQAADLPALTEIHNHYVLHSQASFDTEPQTPEQRRSWFDGYAETGPYRLLVAEAGDKLLGAAWSSRYRPHPAFERTIETSIYLAPDARRQGIGSALYTQLFADLAAEPLHLAVAGIALPNEASIRLHRRFGFTEVGIFKDYALKHGQYISSIWMQKPLNG